jgi:hypothetical protein
VTPARYSAADAEYLLTVSFRNLDGPADPAHLLVRARATDARGSFSEVGPWLARPPGDTLTVGGTTVLSGTGFTAGSVIKLFVNTGASIDDVSGPGGFTPTSWTATSLTWDMPATIPLGQGFASVHLVNTDQGYQTSNTQYALLCGDPADDIPTITTIGGTPLSTTLEAGVPVAHADTVVTPASAVTITGTGFNDPGVNVFGADLDNPGQVKNYGAVWPSAGTATSFEITIPADLPAGPANFQVVNSPYAGNVQSNSVSSVALAQLSISSVTVSGDTVTVNGTGFSPLSVINLFNLQGSGVANLGGLNEAGQAKVPLTFVDSTSFAFTRPAGALAGPAFVEVLNPPYIPYSSSGNDEDGGFGFP